MSRSPLERLLEDCLTGEVEVCHWPNVSREKRVYAQRKAKYITTVLEERYIITERTP